MEIEKIRNDIPILIKYITDKKNCYEAFAIANKASIAKQTELAAKDKSIKESYDKLLSTLTDALASISADRTFELLSAIVLIENNANNTYTSLPFQFIGDQAIVKISIVPRDEKYNLQSYYSQIVFPLEIKKYKVVGVSFYCTSLHDRAYSTIKTDPTSDFSLLEENVSKAELGIAALFRYGEKWNKKNCFGGHFTLGTGISISNKIKPRFLIGGGFSFGKKHMVAIDCGGIVGYVDRLSDAVDLFEPPPEKPENITVSRIGLGIFGSIGYMYQF
jgi:hypothetical protein